MTAQQMGRKGGTRNTPAQRAARRRNASLALAARLQMRLKLNGKGGTVAG